MDIEIDYNPTPKTCYFVSVGLNEKEAISFDNTSKGHRVVKQVLVGQEKQKGTKRKRDKITSEWDAIVLKDGVFVKKYHVTWIDENKFDVVNGEKWETVWEKPINDEMDKKLLCYSRFVSDHYGELGKYSKEMKKFEAFLSVEVARYCQVGTNDF
jgi:hypothetical protein